MAIAQKLALASLLLACLLHSAACQAVSPSAGAVPAPVPATTSAAVADADVVEGRTFGHHFLKRMSFALVPGAFVVGVITTLLAALTVVSMKGLGVGVILLVLAIGQMLGRSLPQVQAAAYTAPAPVPIVYSHAHTQQPVWLEKEW